MGYFFSQHCPPVTKHLQKVLKSQHTVAVATLQYNERGLLLADL